MAGLSRAEAAARAGVDPATVDQLVDAGTLTPDADDRLTAGDVRRIGILRSMLDAGVPLAGISEGMRRGLLSLEFVSAPEYDRFRGLTSETFEEASARTGVPVALLALVREAIGSGAAHPHDLVREDEQPVIGFVELQVQAGFRPLAIERLLRVLGDSLRRVAEAEAEWWRSEILEPGLEAGVRGNEIGSGDVSREMSQRSEAAMLAIYHTQQVQTWGANILSSFEYILEEAGLYNPPERPPAICFLDITGYTRLTEERGDRAAAQLAETLAKLVQRTSVHHGGRPVKWLGDGVMFHFRDPGSGVEAALDMVDGVVAAGLPPAHVGLHVGPVVIQEGDYYGQTVNVAARIADYARPGEVLVSQALVETVSSDRLVFVDVGEVELKGVSGAVHLHAARRPESVG